MRGEPDGPESLTAKNRSRCFVRGSAVEPSTIASSQMVDGKRFTIEDLPALVYSQRGEAGAEA